MEGTDSVIHTSWANAKKKCVPSPQVDIYQQGMLWSHSLEIYEPGVERFLATKPSTTQYQFLESYSAKNFKQTAQGMPSIWDDKFFFWRGRIMGLQQQR